ncbi:MAG: murein biosynthesis integral membrane protein MurJ [Candidatus Omnitrophota bacterium]
MSNEKKPGLDSLRAIVQNMSIVSAGTLTSRILGFFRDVILAKFLGTGLQADALFVAFRIPNLFRDFVGEGAANSTVVPVFSEYAHRDQPREFWRLVAVVLLIATGILTALTVAGMLLAPFIVRILAPGFMAVPEKVALTVQLTRILFPYLIFIGLTAYTMAILYTFRRFAVPAFSPCLLNIAIIVCALLAAHYQWTPVYGVAAGILLGGLLQLAVQIPPVIKAGFRFPPPAPVRHPGVVQIGRLLVPRLIGAGVYQLTIFIDTFCASLAFIVGAGGISAIYYSNRIIQLPMGVFSIALASAVLPTLSSLAAKKDITRLRDTVIFALENIFFVMIPAAVMTMVLARPIIRVLFQRGEFGEYSTMITSSALTFYAIGLFAFGGIKILVSSFHALQDTRTPVKVSASCLVINGVLNVALMFPLKIAGIAFASSVAGLVNFTALLLLLEKRIGSLTETLGAFVLRVLLSAVLSGFAVAWLWNTAPAAEWLKLSVLLPGGMIVYLAGCYYLNVPQARKLIIWIFGKK